MPICRHIAVSSAASAGSGSNPPRSAATAVPTRTGATVLAAQIGQKRAKEIWFLCRQYDAQKALDWGLVNAVVPLERLEEETVQWCREMLALSPLALRMLKCSFNAVLDGQAGVQELAGNATLLFYMTEEAKEGRDAFKEKRKPDFARFPRRP